MSGWRAGCLEVWHTVPEFEVVVAMHLDESTDIQRRIEKKKENKQSYLNKMYFPYLLLLSLTWSALELLVSKCTEICLILQLLLQIILLKLQKKKIIVSQVSEQVIETNF